MPIDSRGFLESLPWGLKSLVRAFLKGVVMVRTQAGELLPLLLLAPLVELMVGSVGERASVEEDGRIVNVPENRKELDVLDDDDDDDVMMMR